MLDEVNSIKALLDAAKPFVDALPEKHPLALIVASFVDAERIRHEGLKSGDTDYFYAAVRDAITRSDAMVEHYSELAEFCDDLPAPRVDSWDGC